MFKVLDQKVNCQKKKKSKNNLPKKAKASNLQLNNFK